MRGASWHLMMGILPWRFPIGLYGQASLFSGFETPPDAYRQLDGPKAGGVYVPRLGAGVILQSGARIGGGGPFGVERPLSTLRRLNLRFGYVQWFGLGSTSGAGALEFSLGGVVGL